MLANAVALKWRCRLTHCVRQQAGSYGPSKFGSMTSRRTPVPLDARAAFSVTCLSREEAGVTTTISTECTHTPTDRVNSDQ